MKKDSHKTKAIFLYNENNNDLFAFFPKDHYHHPGHEAYEKVFNSYAEIGQHSACHIDYAKESIIATPEQYEDLAAELTNIGYNLEILTNL